ncbi:MAG: KilA-N domain-containing protein [Synechococcaceae cyanobacterium]|nr:KilA-N domain-containing protein [Synechococcaceae cyanobacterium]
MTSSAHIVRSWNGHAIQRRLADGYVNATAMAKASGRHLPHYFGTLRACGYIQALQGSVGIPTDLLVQTVTTGPNGGRGTWVHPRLAVDLARWISPEFAVWMDGWILEELEAKAKAATVKPMKPALPLATDDPGALINLVCADMIETVDRIGAMVDWPHQGSLQIASDCLDLLRQRLGMIERLMPMVKPLAPSKTAHRQP